MGKSCISTSSNSDWPQWSKFLMFSISLIKKCHLKDNMDDSRTANIFVLLGTERPFPTYMKLGQYNSNDLIPLKEQSTEIFT